MRRPPSSGSVPDAATPASSLAGSVPAGISVRRTAPAREVKDVVRALAAPRGRTRTRAGRVHCLDIGTISAPVTSFRTLIVVSALRQAVGRRGSEWRALQVLPGPRAAAKHSSTRSGQRVRTD